MANTFEAIQTATVGSGGSSTITFSSIPQTFTDLCIILVSRNDRGSTSNSWGMRINSSTSSYYDVSMSGSGTGVSAVYDQAISADGYIGEVTGNTATANTFGNCEIYIANYAETLYKVWYSNNATSNNGTPAYSSMTAGTLNNTTAITSLTLRSYNAGVYSFLEGSTATLYGIKNS